MSDLIDRDELLFDLNISAETIPVTAVRTLVKVQTKVDPVKHGHWIDYEPNKEYCSMCKNVIRRNYNDLQYKYCPWCGAKMSAERENGQEK